MQRKLILALTLAALATWGPTRAHADVEVRRALLVPQTKTLDRSGHYESFLREASARYVLPVAFLRAVIRVESNFNPLAVSRCGAVGLMQLMPVNIVSMGVDDPYNPRDNIMGGARLLRKLANAWQGDLVLTLASYNAGEGAVRRAIAQHGGIPKYTETQRYVRRVLSFYRAYLARRD